jgi:hypothetical protein
MIGDIIMLAGYIAIWARDDGLEANDETSDDNPVANPVPDTKLAACDARPVSPDGTKLARLDNPGRLSGTALNDGSAEATDSAPV